MANRMVSVHSKNFFALEINAVKNIFVSLQKQHAMTTRENKEKEKSSRENLGKFFYDLAKTCFTAMVVGDVVTMFLKEEVTNMAMVLFFIGVFSTTIFAAIGFKILKR